jgi:hypothetical protein
VGDEFLKRSDFRWELFSMMADHPDEEWTAESLAGALRPVSSGDDAEAFRARIEAIHEVMTGLMGDRWVEPVPFQRLLTVRLTAAGKAQVQRLLEVSRDDAEAGGGDA